MSDLKAAIKGPILVVGANGMLGTDIVHQLSHTFGTSSVVAADSHTLNILSRDSVLKKIQEIRPEWVINAAAYTQVDKAESERASAFSLNVEGPRNLTKVCGELGSRLIHFSTDYVFSGEGNKPWTEEDTPNPPNPNYYAETKLEGEKSVLTNPENLVLRVQWLYGAKKERFSLLKKRASFTPFSDQWGAPTWTKDVANVLMQLMAKNGKGIFHFSYDDCASWAEVYRFVKDEWNLDVKLIPQKSGEINLPAKRPLFGVLSNRKLKEFLGVAEMGSWKKSLKEFLDLVGRD
jgi:dTDP-4-dehydrorhamnose reductase